MNIVYKYRGGFLQGEKGYNMILECASLFADDIGTARPVSILTHQKGKPYFDKSKIEFSLSHSENLWACLFSEVPCGMDIQYKKGTGFHRIAKRIFSERELSYFENAEDKREAFYRIWTRTEAFAKCTGDGIFGKRPELVNESGDFNSSVEWEGKTYYLYEFCPETGFAGAVCFQGQCSGIHIEEFQSKEGQY